ncbi:hypothetical protein M422DRAFT_252990 [Sphaerobolus stellatus SS14]|uniref:Uncharacterized protein n=1 Tax=Sphaerobolus stellatus (strain SS14) TaxID=990650 RepID=A0A0C9VYY3_SPHS4|nr:hypothetical protein M422DRAFT_252990 [Sphaerobolus stellatus SS14]
MFNDHDAPEPDDKPHFSHFQDVPLRDLGDPFEDITCVLEDFERRAPSNGVGLSDAKAWWPWPSKQVYPNLAELLKHELANPLVRQWLKFYAEDGGKSLKEAHQGDKWKLEVEVALAGPMVRKREQEGHEDYYIEEPAAVMLPGYTKAKLVWPVQWFM